MALPSIRVRTATAQLDTGLTAGTQYVAQHVGGSRVRYCNHPTDPTSAEVGWFLLREGEFIIFTVDASNPVWVRCTTGDARLTIAEKA